MKLTMQSAFAFLAVVFVFCSPLSADELLACFDFGAPAREWSYGSLDGAPQFSGPLPDGVAPDFAWTKSVASSTLEESDGCKFVRFSTKSFDRVVMLQAERFRFPQGPGIYRIEVLSRSFNPLSVQLRQGPPPYVLYFNAATSSGPDRFSKSTLYAAFDGREKDVRLFLLLKAGVTDLRSVSISKLSPAEFQASFKRPPKETANFFRNSRFPLGLQAGWTVSPFFEKGVVEADPSEPGPSGCPSLKIAFENDGVSDGPGRSVYRPRVFSEPFQTSDPAVTNHVSFLCKCSGEWTVAATDNFGNWSVSQAKLASKTLQPSTSWTEVSLDFKPDPLAKSFTVAFIGKGVLHMDSLRAWAGENAPARLSQGACEVALGFPKTDVSIARVQFADEPALLDYFASGGIDGATLKMKVANLYGEDFVLPDVKLGRSWLGRLRGAPAPSSERGSVSFERALADKPFGQFRVEAWIEREGVRVSPFNEAIVSRVRRPVHWGEDAPDSPFGAHFSASPILVPMMKAAGVNWVRLHDTGSSYMAWASLEPSKGEWIFQDDAVKRYRDGKIKIAGVLQSAPRWASSLRKLSGSPGDGPYFDKYWSVEDWGAWENYVRTVCSRYKGSIDSYYCWNEPCPTSHSGFYHDGYVQGKGYSISMAKAVEDQARLCEIACKTAKAVDPLIQVAGPESNICGPLGREFNEGAVKSGVFKLCDFADIHVYSQAEAGFPGDDVSRICDELLAPLRASGFSKPFHVSEGKGGWGGLYGNVAGMSKHSVPWDQNPVGSFALAEDNCRYELSLLSRGAARICLYSVFWSFMGKDADCIVLVGEDGYPHPSLVAHSNLAWFLEGSKFVGWERLNEKVFAALFSSRDGGSVAVLSGRRDGEFKALKSSDVEFCDLFGNPSDGFYKGSLLFARSSLSPNALAGALKGSAQSHAP